MSLSVTLLVLLAALLHAFWNAILKSVHGDRLTMVALMAGSGSLMMLPLLLFVPVPSWEVWKLIVLSLVFHTGYKVLLVEAYNHGDFGQVYPLARGLAPAIVTVVGFLFLNELLPPVATLGIAVIVAGIVSLAWRKKGTARPGNSQAILYAVGTSLCIAAYTVNDGIGGRVAASPTDYVIWFFALDGLSIVAVALWRRGPGVFRPQRAWLYGIGGGAASIAAYWLVIWAMSMAPLGPVAALRETSVVFAALISAFILKEGLGWRAFVSTAVVAVGVILLKV